jgi:hypothetical protein
MTEIFQYTVTQPQIHAVYSKIQYSDLRIAAMRLIPFIVGRHSDICKVLQPNQEQRYLYCQYLRDGQIGNGKRHIHCLQRKCP